MVSARFLAASAALAGGVLVAGCGGNPATPAEKAPTSVAGLDSSAMNLVRVKFCDLVPGASITAALGEKVTSHRSWGNGDPVPGTASDIAHELGCAWTAPSGATARAWVFARPVTPTFAADIVKDSRSTKSCQHGQAAGFGDPNVVQVCPQPGNARRVRFAGLIGDTWLTCEVVGHAGTAALRARTSRWCAAVATALDNSAGTG